MINITQVIDLGNDHLRVEGFDDSDNTKLIIAHGWKSAMTHHYPGECYQEDGHLKPDAKPRIMIDSEQKKYFLRLLSEEFSRVNAQDPSKGSVMFRDNNNFKTHNTAVEEIQKEESEDPED